MKKKKLEYTEKINNEVDKTKIVFRTEKEIDDYQRLVGYRKARMKRYGKSATRRMKEKKTENK
ncbi:MAG: hypothetical protein WC867_05350 [Candidatus Pacearchaeota archaeon]|jgi:hypothetical protein